MYVIIIILVLVCRVYTTEWNFDGQMGERESKWTMLYIHTKKASSLLTLIKHCKNAFNQFSVCVCVLCGSMREIFDFSQEIFEFGTDWILFVIVIFGFW